MNNLSQSLRNNYWHLLCHRQEVTNSGDFVRFDWLGEEIVIYNDNGNIIAFNNLCIHRGARVFIDDYGNQRFTCAYHGWSYQNGRICAPKSQVASNTNFLSAKLNLIEIDWCGDFLFASIFPQSSLSNQLADCAPIVKAISHSISDRYDFNRYDYKCNWAIAVENALEPIHVPFIHTSSLGQLQLNDGNNNFSKLNSTCYFSIGNNRMRKQLSNLKKCFSTDFQYEGYMSIFLFPFTMLSSTFGYSYSLQNFLPTLNDNLTHFTSRLFTSNLSKLSYSQIVEPLFQSAAKMNRQVFDEDRLICERVPSSSWSVEPHPLATQDEDRILHFRKNCKDELNYRGSRLSEMSLN